MLRKPSLLKRIENTMESLSKDSVRYRVLDTCRKFKTTWIELGQALFSVQKDKLYKGWGFLTFENYCTKELGLRSATAAKLLKSYFFLESEEPGFIKAAKDETLTGNKYPDLESVNLLRLAKSRSQIDQNTYGRIRKRVFDDAKDANEIRREIRFLLGEDTSKSSPQIRSERRARFLKSLSKTLEEAGREGMSTHFLPMPLLREMERLREKIQREMLG